MNERATAHCGVRISIDDDTWRLAVPALRPWQASRVLFKGGLVLVRKSGRVLAPSTAHQDLTDDALALKCFCSMDCGNGVPAAVMAGNFDLLVQQRR